MIAGFPLEILQTIARAYPFRETQIQYVATLYNDIFPPPRTLVAHGLEHTSKLEVISVVLDARSLRYVVVKCRECLSQRHLLAKIFAACLNALNVEEDVDQYDRIDSLNALTVGLERLFKRQDEKVILVLDSIDKQRGPGATLLPALARLSEMIPRLSMIMISSSPRPLQLHKTGVPYIYFPPYTRAEAVHLVTQGDPPVPEAATDIRVDDLRKIYVQFAVTVYDSLVSATSSTSIRSFRTLCQKLWPRFIWPAMSGELPSGKTKARTWDFARLLIRNRTLFQIEGETALIDRLQPVSTASTFRELRIQSQTHPPQKKALPTSTAPAGPTTSGQLATASATNTSTLALPPLLKHFPTIILLSSYLASHTLTKNDIVLFSRLSSSTKRVRKYRTPKKSVFKSPSKTFTKAASTIEVGGGGNADTTGTPSGMTKNMLGRTRTLFDLKFGAPKGFSLERVVAISRAVHPDGFKHTKSAADRVHRAMGELERLRLVEKVSADDEVEGGGKWKIAVGREVVEGMLVGWGVKGGVGEWELQGQE